jgi:nicotinate-nucleotide adenylyltransferase
MRQIPFWTCAPGCYNPEPFETCGLQTGGTSFSSLEGHHGVLALSDNGTKSTGSAKASAIAGWSDRTEAAAPLDGRTERIGIFGGTFDPVHNGHLHIANALRLSLCLDHVMWVPAGRPPHKHGQIVSDDRDRLQMLRLALAGSRRDVISTIELDRVGPSYTADTLALLHDRLAPARLYFLMGEDSLRDLPTWRDPYRILANADIAVAGRPGVETDLDDLYAELPGLRDRLHIVLTDELAISSSEIRDRIASGQSISELVPLAVADYIAKRLLYRD